MEFLGFKNWNPLFHLGSHLGPFSKQNTATWTPRSTTKVPNANRKIQRETKQNVYEET